MSQTDSPRETTQDEQARVLEAALDRHIEWVSQHESKATFVMGIVTGMLGALAALAPASPMWTPALLVVGGVTLGALSLSVVCLYFANYPRTSGPASLIFFGAIAAMSADEYRRRIRGLSSREYLDDLANQCHEVSRILTTKYRLLSWAFRGLFLSLPFWVVTMYLIRFASAKP